MADYFDNYHSNPCSCIEKRLNMSDEKSNKFLWYAIPLMILGAPILLYFGARAIIGGIIFFGGAALLNKLYDEFFGK